MARAVFGPMARVTTIGSMTLNPLVKTNPNTIDSEILIAAFKSRVAQYQKFVRVLQVAFQARGGFTAKGKITACDLAFESNAFNFAPAAPDFAVHHGRLGEFDLV